MLSFSCCSLCFYWRGVPQAISETCAMLSSSQTTPQKRPNQTCSHRQRIPGSRQKPQRLHSMTRALQRMTTPRTKQWSSEIFRLAYTTITFAKKQSGKRESTYGYADIILLVAQGNPNLWHDLYIWDPDLMQFSYVQCDQWLGAVAVYPGYIENQYRVLMDNSYITQRLIWEGNRLVVQSEETFIPG
jgi:hypothetical protein